VLESLDANVGVFKITALRPYQAIIRTLAAGRYVDRDLAGAAGARTAGLSPTRPRDRGPFDPAGVHYTCFQFDYDWRRDVSEQAERLDRLVRAASDAATRGRGLDRPARVDIVAHSMGGLVALYYLRFGPHPLPEDGSTPPVTWEGAALVDRVLIVGTPSAGSVLSLKQLVEGTRHAPITPTYRPAVLATMPSIYQLLPRPRQGRVVEDGSGAACDVYDAAAWERRRWGPFDPREDRTLEWLLPGSNTPADRRRIAGEHLAKCLARARQFHAALDAPAEFPPHLEVHLFVGDAEPTPDVLTVGPGGVLSVRSVAPGDGTVTRASALMDERVGGEWCPALASPIPWTSVTFIPADHVGLTEHPTFTDQALHLLLERPRRRHAGG
jgi:pimeloyl-ACP methyl ester carboxylesterase